MGGIRSNHLRENFLRVSQLYYIDTNCFIEPYNKFYPFDIAPAYWDFILMNCDRGNSVVIDQVRDEVYKKEDGIKQWLKKEFKSSFVASSVPEVIQVHNEILAWVSDSGRFTENAIKTFGNVADPWLIAHAKAFDGILVTLEQPDPKARRKVFIPEVCKALSVSWISLFEWLRRMQFQFNR